STKVYDGTAFSGGNEVIYDGFVNSEDESVLSGTLSYTGTAQNAENAGDYIITPQGLTSDNYEITFADGILDITKAPLTITAKDSTKVYDGTAFSGGNGVLYSGFVNSEDESVLS